MRWWGGNFGMVVVVEGNGGGVEVMVGLYNSGDSLTIYV